MNKFYKKISKAKLKPCPFCGQDARVARQRNELWYAECSNYGCVVSNSNIGFDTEEEAVEAWNRRY